jgi:hypothetical protein
MGFQLQGTAQEVNTLIRLPGLRKDQPQHVQTADVQRLLGQDVLIGLSGQLQSP